MGQEEIIDGFRRGEKRALSRAISIVEREEPGHAELLDTLFPATGRATRIGVTGPPGAGKSTLVSRLAGAFRQRKETVGIVAVDPSSPLSGGALLGDRVRMADHFLDEGVFIRSMATRGSLGGLARRSVEVADLLDAHGFDRLLIETVGVGQIEHDIMEATDLVLVVLHPGAGDAIQAMKAGLLELADAFVLNKADRPDIQRLDSDLREMLELRLATDRRGTEIHRTVAISGDGVPELVMCLDRQLSELDLSGILARRRRRRHLDQVRRILEEQLRLHLWGADGVRGQLLDLLEVGTERPPYQQARDLLARLLPDGTIAGASERSVSDG
ncbi:MAG: methylmalonyl Co-A mutase-associated GTPase MeaB [Planctomycetota bacterium]